MKRDIHDVDTAFAATECVPNSGNLRLQYFRGEARETIDASNFLN